MSEEMFRVRFVNQDEVYELYARQVYASDVFGFVVLEDFVFDTATKVLVDPAEEKLKSEFEGVKRTLVPMQSIIRIDEVDKRGKLSVQPLGDVVRPFPGLGPGMTPGKGGVPGRRKDD